MDSVPADRFPEEILKLAGSREDGKRLLAVRALGALEGRGAVDLVLAVLQPYRHRDFSGLNPDQKHLAQSCIRSLGRLGDTSALPVLIDFLDSAGFARYAADALGDLGDPRAVRPLITAYPKFAREVNNRMSRPKMYPRDDGIAGDASQDRMFETPYAIAMALSRLPLDDKKDLEALLDMGPLLVANLPSDWDGGVLYEIEAYQLITAYLLEKVGMRQMVCDIAFQSAANHENWVQYDRRNPFAVEGLAMKDRLKALSMRRMGDVPYVAAWIVALSREKDIPTLLSLLEHPNGWIRINTAKALMFVGGQQAVAPMVKSLTRSHAEAEYGYSGVLEHEEYNDPAPRWREAYIRGLGRLGAGEQVGLLRRMLEDDSNVVDVRYSAALALDELGTREALAALRHAEVNHPFESVRLVAREALWRRGMEQTERKAVSQPPPMAQEDQPASPTLPTTYVFIKGENEMRSDFNAQSGLDPWRQTYTVNNSAPTMRVGRNLYLLRKSGGEPRVTQLTHFEHGYVADCEVSWDGKRIIFSRRRNNEDRNYTEVPHEPARLRRRGEFELDGEDDPWWHVWEINADGSGLRQVSRGPFHDVQPAYLPDGRIVFASTRLGLRDEYHGYASIGLAVMNADGSDSHIIGFNLGGDREPAVLADGRIAFSRLDVFYSRLKSELTVQSVFPDGTKNDVLYGPERRGFWMDVHRKNAAWTLRSAYGKSRDNRNRVLRISQPQPLGVGGRLIAASSGGLVVLGPGRAQEKLVPHDRKWAMTSPFPVGQGKVVAAASVKQFKVDGRIVTAGSEEFESLEKGPELFRSAINIDLGLYTVDVKTGKTTLLYNDPEMAEFEARPLVARPLPHTAAEAPYTRLASYTAKLFCFSATISREDRVSQRGRLLRVVEGQPFVSRHQAQKNAFISSSNRWKNHGGTHARVLGTIPLAADGSFFVEVPADRLIHLQVLDSDRRVLGNQLFWMYARSGETRACIGCHESPDVTLAPEHTARASLVPPVKTLPTGGEFSYRAKTWIKGMLPDEIEERARTVRAVNLIGRQ